MLIELTRINSLQVAAFDKGGAIGKVVKTVISKEEAKALGFVVRLPGIFSSYKVLSIEDVVSIDQSGIVVRSSEALVDTDEIIRMEQIIKSNFSIIGLLARDEKGNKLGKINDVLIDVDTGLIMRLYTKHYMTNKVYDRSQIVEINDKYIVIKNEKPEKIKKTAPSLAEVKIA